MGSEILVKIGLPLPPKKNPKPQKTLIETLRLCNFCNFGATLLGFGTVFTNIILHGFRNFGKNRITLTPLKTPKTPRGHLWKLCDFVTLQFWSYTFGIWYSVY